MNAQSIAELRALLGKAVLLPVPLGEKGCLLKGWQKLTYASSLSPDHEAELLAFGNVGVLLGRNSDNLISIDCDSDDFLAQMLIANPSFRSTLQTKGARGGNLWLRIRGDYPPTRRLGCAAAPLGEWRSHNSYTVIAGRHPSGKDYEFVVKAPPLEVAFKDICWPENAGPPSLCSTESLPSANAASCAPASLHHTNSKGAAIRADLTLEKDYPHLSRILGIVLHDLAHLEEGNRNHTLTHLIAPRLFTKVSPDVAGRLLEHLIMTDRLGGYPSGEARLKFSHVLDAMRKS